jgi:glycogen synthase
MPNKQVQASSAIGLESHVVYVAASIEKLSALLGAVLPSRSSSRMTALPRSVFFARHSEESYASSLIHQRVSAECLRRRRCTRGRQESDTATLHVIGAEPWIEITEGASGKFKGALEALSLNLTQIKALSGVDVVHTHTWYVAMAGFLAKKLYGIPFVLTVHSLEPLRAWKAEQLGSGYAMSSWMEKTAILDADAVIAVSKGTREDIIRAYPEIDPAKIHVIYNGIALQEYRKTSETKALTDYGVDPTRPYVLFVGRITRQKGVTHLVDAIEYMPPETQVVLCAGAPDTPEIAEEMRQKFAAAHKKNRRQRRSNSTRMPRSFVALRYMSRLGLSISKRWPARRRSWRVQPGASRRSWSTAKRDTWFHLSPIR